MFQHATRVVLLTTVINFLVADGNQVAAQPAEAQPAEAQPAEAQPAKPHQKVEQVGDPAHLISLVDRNKLVHSSIPAADAQDQSVKTRSVMTDQRYGGQMRPLGVYGGHLLVHMERNLTLVAIDVQSGDIRRLADGAVRNAVRAEHHIYYIAVVPPKVEGDPTHALMHLDLRTMKRQELQRLRSDRSSMQPIWLVDFSMAISPDGSRVAVTEMKGGGGLVIITPPTQIVIAGANGKVVRSVREFPARYHSTGGGDRLLAPKIAWTKDDSVVVVFTRAKGLGLELATADGPIMDVALVEAESGETKPVCELPGFYPRMYEPWFSTNEKRDTLIHLGGRGQYRIDYENEKLVETSTLGGPYNLTGAERHFSLNYGDEILEANTLPHRVFPNGSRIAWLPSDYGAMPRSPLVKGILNLPMSLKTHDKVRGTRTIFEGRFTRQGETTQNPSLNVCVWATESDMERLRVFDTLKIEVNTPPKPRPVTRSPDIKSSLKIAMTTDKTVYKRHEPMTLTISIKNLTKTPVRFETKRLLGGAMPFGLEIKSARTRQRIELFDRYLFKPKQEFFDLLPGKVTTLERTIDIEELGEQELRLRFQHYETWRGTYHVSAKFEVLEESTDALLQKKFDRIMSRCLMQYEHGPNVVNPARFVDLGEDAVPLMIEYLRNCEDGELRQSLGKGLSGIANEAALPYLADLVSGDLEYEGDTLVACLWRLSGFYTNRDDKTSQLARRLLFTTGRHKNVKARKKVVDTLHRLVHDEVDQFMLQASEDSDPTVSATAAKYVAARQQLSLEEWFKYASENHTEASVAAARPIVQELKLVWKTDLGELPPGSAAELIANGQKQEWIFMMQKWQKWCHENPRTSTNYFDAIQGKARKMQTLFKVWGEGGKPAPIKLPKS